MREITSHKVNGLNEVLRVDVLDEPSHGNASHAYRITCARPADADPECLHRFWAGSERDICQINFQAGPISECGVNGISNEALLAIVEDRLQGFQSGPYACRENAVALTKIQEAMMWLAKRTRDRMVRGVEGTSVV